MLLRDSVHKHVIIIICFILLENIKNARGRYTDKHLDRVSKTCGSFGKDLDQLFTGKMAETYMGKSKYEPVSYRMQVLRFTQMYNREDFFNYVPGREHTSFPDFQLVPLKKPGKMKARLKKYSRNLDMQRDVIGN